MMAKETTARNYGGAEFCWDFINGSLKREAELTAALEGEADPARAAARRLSLADELVDRASHHLALSHLSLVSREIRDEEALNDTRKTLVRALGVLEELVTGKVNAPYADYADKVELLEEVGPGWRYLFVRKLGLALDLLKNAYGDNTRWKWVFLELEGRYTAVTKNLLDMKKALGNPDPSSPDYEPLVRHLRLVKELLERMAGRYREKYELTTGVPGDFMAALNFIEALRRLHLLLGEAEEADILKKRLDVWQNKLEGDLRKKDEAEAQTPGQGGNG